MRFRKARFQHGSISKVKRAHGFVWKVRFSETRERKRWQRTLTFNGSDYPTEKAVREAIHLTIAQVNSGTAGEIADPKFGAVIALYRTKHLATLQHSTQEHSKYVLSHFIEPEFAHTPIREMKPLAIDTWLQGLKLNPTTKASIRSVMSVCFRLAQLHEFIPQSMNPMSLIRLKGVTKRQKPITELTVEGFKRLVAALPEPVNLMALLTGALGLRISETLALQWADIDAKAGTVTIRRKFTRGQIGSPKTESSAAVLPIDVKLIDALKAWKLKTGDSEWMFPSPVTDGPRSASMLLQKALVPAADRLGLGRITWHTLRHACRSWLAAGAVELSTQKDLLRHADISTTANIYGHALSEKMREAHAALVNQLVDKERPGTNWPARRILYQRS